MSHHSYLACPGGALWGGQQMCITKTVTAIITLSHMYILYMWQWQEEGNRKTGQAQVINQICMILLMLVTEYVLLSFSTNGSFPPCVTFRDTVDCILLCASLLPAALIEVMVKLTHSNSPWLWHVFQNTLCGIQPLTQTNCCRCLANLMRKHIVCYQWRSLNKMFCAHLGTTFCLSWPLRPHIARTLPFKFLSHNRAHFHIRDLMSQYKI